MEENILEFGAGGIKTDKMSAKERMSALIKGKALDRVPFIPFILGFAAKNAGTPVSAFYAEPEVSFCVQKHMEQQYNLDGNPVYGYADYGAWEFGVEARFPYFPNEQSIMVLRRPVEREEQGWNLKLPDVKTAGCLPIMMKFAKLQKEYVGSASCFSMTPFCIAVSIAGEERFCRWMITNPDLCHHLLRLATEHSMQVINYWVDTFGIESIRVDRSTGPETNDVISPNQFKEFALPYMKELHEHILSMGFRSIYCHICGDHSLNWPYWQEVPFGEPGMMTFAHQIDLVKAIELFGNKNIIFGNIEPALILEGTPQQVYEACRKAIAIGKNAPKGFVLNSGCELSPDTPPYNLWVMRKAVNDFGWYE